MQAIRSSRASRTFYILVGILLILAYAARAAGPSASITISADQPSVTVSSNLFGIFFEEINSAGDGGIYAEMVRNRSFEDDTNTPINWTLSTTGTAAGQMTLDTSLPLSPTNLQSLKLTMASGTGTVGAANNGYWGMTISNGATYKLGFYARAATGFTGSIQAYLTSTNGITYAQGSVSGLTAAWQHFSMLFTPETTDGNAQLVLSISQSGTVFLDFVSLFPKQTFKSRSNGLRPDLAQELVNLKPSFMRFPGGSWVDGSSLADAYHWEPTVGDPANRVPRANLWGYMVDNGLGYHEYLQMCEDIGAQPLFVINCGMDVSQNPVPTSQLGPWVQEALDAIQYANGATDTPWGAYRAANGHPAPFNLQYMEIGNENNTQAYDDHYAMFYDAIKSNYPYMHLIANSQGTIPVSRPVEIVDEHYYSNPSFFINNATKYDSYSRSGPKVYVGEYAVTTGAGNGNLAGALGEAAFMTGLERNSDIVAMASYAPLFANLNNKDWNPDLIYFTGQQACGTPSYYVQQMFSLNRGGLVLPTVVNTSDIGAAGDQGAIGLGSWNTSVQYTNIVVTSNGVTLYQSDFARTDADEWTVAHGTWNVANGLYQQTALITDCISTTGNTNWANYTITLRALKTGGAEGFLIVFNWLDNNDLTWWNIGGWGNTLDAIEQTADGSKSLISPQLSESITANQWYDIRIVLTGPRIQCYLNNQLIHDINYPTNTALVASSTYAPNSGQIIVKAVNVSSQPLTTLLAVNTARGLDSNATAVVLTSSNPNDENSLGQPTYVFPVTNAIANASTNFPCTLPANSLTVFRFQQLPASSVDIGLTASIAQQNLDSLTNGISIGLDSFITNAISVSYTADTPSGTLATGFVQFSTGGNITQNIPLPAVDLTNYNIIRVTLTDPTNGVLNAGAQEWFVRPFTNALPELGVAQFPDETVAYWTTASASLQMANDLDGPWTTLSNATSPFQIIPTGPRQFYRLTAPATSAILIDRYSFNNGNASDSIGTNNGTFYNASGRSSIAGGQLNLSGSNGDYVDLGPGIITTNLSRNAITLEAWASFNSNNGVWARLFDFGNIINNAGVDYIFFSPAANGGTSRLGVAGAAGNADETGFNTDSLLGQTNLHVVVVFNPNPNRQFLALYVNSVLIASSSTGNKSLASIDNVFSFLGRSLFSGSGDAWLNGSIDEFRIYNGELTSAQIQTTQSLGPNQLLPGASP